MFYKCLCYIVENPSHCDTLHIGAEKMATGSLKWTTFFFRAVLG